MSSNKRTEQDYLDELQRLRARVAELEAAEQARQTAEEQLQLSQARFAKIFRLSPLPTAITRQNDGTYLDVNDSFLRQTGFSREEIIGRRAVEGIWATVEDREKFIEELNTHGAINAMEVRLGNKNGQYEKGLITADIIELDGEKCVLSLFLNIDSYTKTLNQLQQAREQLLQAQKMESIGRLAGGIAHDFNNLLTVITGYSEFILMDLPENNALRPTLLEISKAADRAAVLTRQLLAFSRRQVLQPKIININAVVNDMNKMLERVIGEDIDLICKLDPNLGNVEVDTGQLEQIVMNLVVNARDAMPNGGRLLIETTNVELDAAYTTPEFPAVQSGEYVMLSVTDTGIGMDGATQARIFEPFFSTKEPGKGTGLGLAMVYGIVQQSKGSIFVYSVPQVGTTFKIYLPLHTGSNTPSVVTKPQNSIENLVGWETILLVEDEEMVRNLARRVLQNYGYKVLEASNGREALALQVVRSAPIQLLVSDIVMPEMSGPELVQHLRQLQPKIRVLYMSGYPDRLNSSYNNALVYDGFLQKPFTPLNFARKVREVLNSLN